MAHTTTSEAKWTAKARRDYLKQHPENFAGPDGSYPIRDRSDVGDAWGLAGHASDPDAVRRKIISIAKRMGFTDALPDTAKDFMQSGGKKESSLPAESVSLIPGSDPLSKAATRSPRTRIATIQVCWIEDNARSLNGRIYPESAVNTLIASAQRKLSDANALPITCFLSHADADEDRTPALIGRVTRVWREGARGMATIDLADTSAARDALALISGGYLCTESLRARGAELRTDKRYDVPIVGGDNLELEGIDLTNYPGLEQVARIQQIHLAESADRDTGLTEVFALTPSSVHFHFKELGMPKKLSPLTEAKLREEGILPRVSGDSPSMTSDPTGDAYQQKLYPVPGLTDPTTMPTDKSAQIMEAMKRAHDHLANVLDATLTPIHSKESLPPNTPLSEAGRKLAQKHAAHLMAAHDEAARECGLGCAGGYGMMGGQMMSKDGDGDDDNDSDESRVRPDGPANPQMTPGFADQAAPGIAAKKGKKMTAFQPATATAVGADSMESEKKARKRALKEALALLENEGYDVKLDKKKSETELLQERLAALEETRAKEMAELKEMLANRAPAQPAPQRRSQVVGANVGAPLIGGQPIHGRHLQEQIKSLDWQSLTDRTHPLPENIPLELLIKEFEQYYAVLYDGKYGILTAANQ